MTSQLSTTGRIRLEIEIDWNHTFDENAKAADIYTTVAKECEATLRNALIASKVSFRIIGSVQPIMVVHPVSKL